MAGAFNVVNGFKATNVNSGREREFKPGEKLAGGEQTDGNVTIEIDNSFFLVELSVFEKCCKRNNDGAAPFFDSLISRWTAQSRYFFSGRNPERLRKPVSILPATKSGWARIFWCRGIEV